jgi:membrane protein DedA with SNARE-associated domain/rhodanese-related sulfurtransferase
MESWISGLAQHGYFILFLIVFLEAIGLPIPAALGMLIAGAASARGGLSLAAVVGGSIASMMLGDILMFLMGRYTGWWLLGLLCRLSLNPESCILRSADSFYRRGRTLLVIAKFIPGINTMAPPLAGSMNMRLFPFLRLDLAGAVLYTGAYILAGYLGSGALGALTSGYKALGQVLGWIFLAAAAGYVLLQARLWTKARAWRSVPFVSPAEAARQLSSGAAVVYDVRSHGYYDPKATRIHGSRRMDPNALHQSQQPDATGRQIYLYCTCVREATSGRVALLLREQGIHSCVIQGGLRAWRKAGLPVEPVPSEEMAAMPAFDS